MTTITSLDLWKSLGKNSYTKIRTEAVGTGDGVETTFSLEFDNLITDSTTLYANAVEITTSYTIDLDDGVVTGLTLASDSALTADYSKADIPDSHIQEVLARADENLTSSTGRDFVLTTTTEYISVEDTRQDEYFLKHWPATTISSLEMNQNGPTDTPDWESRTQGLGNDFIFNDEDRSNGRFRIIDNFPMKGKDIIKVTYVHGYSTIPKRAEELATLLSQKELINSTIYQTIYLGRDDSSPINLDVVENRITALTNELKSMNIEKP